MENKNQQEPILVNSNTATLETEAKLGHLSRYLNVFISPKKAFEDVDRAPKVLIPILVVMVLTSLLMFMNYDLILEQSQEAMLKQALETTGEVPADGMMGIAKITTIFAIFFAGVGALIASLLSSALSRGVATFMDGEGSYKRLLSVYLYAYIIAFVGQAVIIALNSGMDLQNISLSLAMFLPENAPHALVLFLGTFNVFGIWNLLLVTIGIQMTERLSFVKSLICAIVPTLLLLGVQIVLS